MACEFSNNSVQTVNPGETVIFTNTPVPCTQGLIRHRDDTGTFLIAGKVNRCHCGCLPKTANYLIDFGANIAIPTGGTVEPISLAIMLDGATMPTTEMVATPAAVEQYSNVSDATIAQIWSGCCETLAVTNTSSQAILVQNANIIFARADGYQM
jgi:hypothetical protein